MRQNTLCQNPLPSHIATAPPAEWANRRLLEESFNENLTTHFGRPTTPNKRSGKAKGAQRYLHSVKGTMRTLKNFEQNLKSFFFSLSRIRFGRLDQGTKLRNELSSVACSLLRHPSPTIKG